MSQPDFSIFQNAWKVVIEQLEQQTKDIQELKDKVAKLEGGKE